MATYPTPPNQSKRKRTMSESSAGQRKRTPKSASDYAKRPKRIPKTLEMPKGPSDYAIRPRRIPKGTTPKGPSDYAIRPKRTPKGNAMPAIWYKGRGGSSAVAIKPAYKNPLKKGSSARTIKPARRPRQMGR